MHALLATRRAFHSFGKSSMLRYIWKPEFSECSLGCTAERVSDLCVCPSCILVPERCSSAFRNIVFYRRKTQASGFEWGQDPRTTCKNICHSVFCLSWHLSWEVLLLEAKCRLREGYILFGEQPKSTAWNVKYIYFIHSNAFLSIPLGEHLCILVLLVQILKENTSYFGCLPTLMWTSFDTFMVNSKVLHPSPFAQVKTYFSENIVYRAHKHF